VDEEFEAGLVGVAAPVLDFDGRVVAALNLSGPKFRAGKRLVTAGPRLTEIAAELSGLLGRSPGAGVAEPASA
jgi:DNA-binding IclR family transcriptional regulator